MKQHIFKYNAPFELELGGILPYLEITYYTAGHYNSAKNNVVWACHSLTGDANVFDWWDGLFGNNKLYNSKEHFIICANALGSCYGTTGATNTAPEFQLHSFPQITIRDMVKAHDLLRQYLALEHIHTVIGGSSGGKQVLEWAIQRPDVFENVITIAASAKQSPWAIAFSASQQIAISQDPTWKENHIEAGKNGLKTARAIAMLSYRHFETYQISQSETDNEKVSDFKSTSYQEYQGSKFVKRFDAFTYMTMCKAMDAYNLGRNRGGTANALQQIKARVLTIGIDTDMLFPVHEQKYIAENINRGIYVEIQSLHGHDGFLIEAEQISKAILAFYKNLNSQMISTININWN
jgi:homoserine O-acetyltransferase